MLVGYARTSTIEQAAGLDAQLTALAQAGCEEVFQEQVSSVQRREQLEAALKYVRQGDTLTVTKLDRLARSVPDLVRILEQLEAKGTTLRILDMNLDTGSPTGRLLLNLVGSVAQFEREIMLERQREGIAKAKAEGRYKGRAPTAREKAGRIRELREQGKTVAEVVELTGVSRASVYRVLSTHNA